MRKPVPYRFSGRRVLWRRLALACRWVLVVSIPATMLFFVSVKSAYGLDLKDPKVQQVVQRGLDWLAKNQSRAGH